MFDFTPGKRNPKQPGRGIAFRLSFWILLFAAIIFTLVFGYSYLLSRRLLVKTIEQNAVEMAQGQAARLDTVLSAVQKIPQNLSLAVSDPAFAHSEKLLGLMKEALLRNPEIYGLAVAFEPYAWDGKTRLYAPYVYRKNDAIVSMFVTYDYPAWDWYRLPVQQKGPLWAEPYFDKGAGNIMMSTYSVPFYRTLQGRKTLAGVVTVDISLDGLQKILAKIKIGSDGYAFLISRQGNIVTHPNQRLIMNKTIFALSREIADASLADIGRMMIQGQTGVAESHDVMDGDRCWLAYAPLSSTGWSLGLLFPRDDLMADVVWHYRLTLGLGILGLMILCGVIVWIARGITHPLRELTAATRTLARGDLQMALPEIRSRDEVGTLAASFAAMRKSLQAYIRDLTDTTAAKERIESELKIAHDMQMSLLPRTFPPFPERPEADLYALLLPAREVGGDLYDFFYMDEDHLCFAVGDVSGKGMPAAFHMAMTKMLIKTKATQGLAPEVILARVNEDLALDNPSLIFVTVFLGVLNVRTGELVYANGGHPPPYVLRATGDIAALPVTGGMALGVVEKFDYRSRSVMLQKKDTVFLFSDGVTEAANAANTLFGDQRLAAALGRLYDQPLQTLTDGVLTDIQAFAQGAPQADDITMLAVRFLGTNT